MRDMGRGFDSQKHLFRSEEELLYYLSARLNDRTVSSLNLRGEADDVLAE